MAIEASHRPLPSFSYCCSSSFSVLPLLVEATQITMSSPNRKERERERGRKCQRLGQTHGTHTRTLLTRTHFSHTHTLLSLSHTHTHCPQPRARPRSSSSLESISRRSHLHFTALSLSISPFLASSSAPCHLSHECRLFAIGSSTEAVREGDGDRDADRDRAAPAAAFPSVSQCNPMPSVCRPFSSSSSLSSPLC